MTLVPDPTIYPIYFQLSKRRSVGISQEYGPGLIGMDSGSIISATLRYSEKYLIDFDPFSPSVPSSSSGSVVEYELVPTSSSASSASIQLKVWTSASKFNSYLQGQIVSTRQEICASDTVHSMSVSESFRSMLPVVYQGIEYFPLVSLVYLCTPFSDEGATSSSGSVNTGESSQFTAMPGGDRGIIYSKISWSPSWFYDRSRTIQVSSPPEGLPSLSGSIFMRHIITAGQNFVYDGSILSSGVSSFNSIPRGENSPLIEISYVKESDFSVMFSTVKFNSDGMPDQLSNDTSIYIVPS